LAVEARSTIEHTRPVVSAAFNATMRIQDEISSPVRSAATFIFDF